MNAVAAKTSHPSFNGRTISLATTKPAVSVKPVVRVCFDCERPMGNGEDCCLCAADGE